MIIFKDDFKILIITLFHSGLEGLCIFLRRLAYPNRLTDLERIFGLSAPYISMVCKHVMHIIHEKAVFLLTNLRNVRWLTRAKLRFYSNAVGSHNVPIENCWGFIDGTARPICRPSVNQEEYFSGHKRVHCVKYQSTVCPDGMIISLKGPFPGRMHDAGILRRSNFYSELKECVTFPDGEKFVLYGDSAYPIRELLLKPFTGNNLTPQQIHFNSAMSTVRQAVEWGFGKVIREFAFLDFKKNQKINLQELEKMYFTAVLMTNCHTCLYGSQTGHYFNISPPTLREYLSQ